MVDRHTCIRFSPSVYNSFLTVIIRNPMASEIKKEYGKILSDLANTMLSVARESVTLIKRSEPEVAPK